MEPPASAKKLPPSLMQQLGRGAVLAFGYFASAIVSALVAAAGLTSYEYLVRGGESKAGLSPGEMLTHALGLTWFTAAIILILCVPVAWIPLWLSLACMQRVYRGGFVACLVAGAVTGSILAVWVFVIGSQVLPVPFFADPDDRLPLWKGLMRLVPFAVPGGAAGGLVLWALCYRAPRPP